MEIITFDVLGAQVKGYLQADHERLKAHKIRPALIICAGGGYQHLSPREKDPVALEFARLGYQTFNLEYSCKEQAGNYLPLRQLAETAAYLRRQSETWHIDETKIAVLGFSAGGHLAGSLGALWNDGSLGLPENCRPDALILCYPVASMYEYAHEESVRWVSGGDEAIRKKLHLWDHISPDFPPVFLWHGGEDDSVPPENSLFLAVQLRKNRVPFEYHLFETGMHGISTCTQEVEAPEENCRAWITLCEKWLNHRFAFVP